MSYAIERVLPVQNEHGEGPVWDSATQTLYWVDIKGERFFRYQPATGHYESFWVGAQVGVLAVREQGGLIMATNQGFARWDFATGRPEFIGHPEADRPEMRFNDGAVDPQGRFWAGTMGEAEELQKAGAGKLYRLDPDGTIHTMETNLGIPNGIKWSLDNRTMYFTDSTPKTVWAYDFDGATGAISNRRPFFKMDAADGTPDGTGQDADGNLWIACWGGQQLVKINPQGELVERVKMPVGHPTSCTFGGTELSDLYVTSCAFPVMDEPRKVHPYAGDIFKISTNLKGRPETKFKG